MTYSLTPTNRHHRLDDCRWCGGRSHPAALAGWYVAYQLLTGPETAGPYPQDEAARLVLTHADPSSVAVLVGPDGRVYDVRPREQP